MENTCIVCGKKFRPKSWNQTVCGEECKKKRQYECWLRHQKKKEAQIKQEEAKLKEPKKKVKLPPNKSNVTVKANDPKWVREYAAGDRLTQIATQLFLCYGHL